MYGVQEVPEVAQSQLELADSLVTASTIAVNVMTLVTTVLFLRWVHGIVKLTRALGAEDFAWRPAQAVWGFFIPFISLVRPYRVLRDVQQRLEPEEIAPPAPRLDRDAQVDYRNVKFVVPPAPRRIPESLLGLWWGAFVAGMVLQRVSNGLGRSASGIEAIITAYRFEMFVSVIFLASAALGIRVVRGLTARLEERFRRIRHSSPDELAQQRIVLS